MNIVQLGRFAEIAFLLFKLISCFTGSFLCIYVIGRILFNGFSFSIMIRQPNLNQLDDSEDNQEDNKE